MKSCPHLADIEELALGELDAAPAARLLAHVASCAECREELAMVRAERALFARRAELAREPLPPLVLPRRFAVATGLGRFLRRGQATVACAAALFVVAAFSRVGSPSASITSITRDDGAQLGASGMLASFLAAEPLECSPGSVTATSHDDGAMSSSSMLAASRSEVLACGANANGAHVTTACEPFVTCSALRQ